MKAKVRRFLASAAVLACLAAPQVASALSVYDVIMMSRNGYEPESIIRLINDTGSAFTLEALDAVRLKDAGVSDEVVAAMFAAAPAPMTGENGEMLAAEMPPPATMADLILLAEGKISEKVIIAFLDSRGISFKPDSVAVTRLREAGLGEDVLNHLVMRTAIRPVPDSQYAAPQEPPTAPAPPATAYAPPREEGGITTYREETSYSLPGYSTTYTYIYPPYYYGPSYFIGFAGLHHSMFRHRYSHAHPYPGDFFFNREHAFFQKKHKHRDGKRDDHDKDWRHDHDRGRSWTRERHDRDSRQATRSGGGSSGGIVSNPADRASPPSRSSASTGSRASASTTRPTTPSTGGRWNELYNTGPGTNLWGIGGNSARTESTSRLPSRPTAQSTSRPASSSSSRSNSSARSQSTREDSGRRSTAAPSSTGSRWTELYNTPPSGSSQWGIGSSTTRSGTAGTSQSRSAFESARTTPSASTFRSTGSPQYGSAASRPSSRSTSSVTGNTAPGSSVTGSTSRSSSVTGSAARSSSVTGSTSAAPASRSSDAGNSASGSRSSASSSSGVGRSWSDRANGSGSTSRLNRR